MFNKLCVSYDTGTTISEALKCEALDENIDKKNIFVTIDGKQIKQYDWWRSPKAGKIKIKLIHYVSDVLQAVEIKFSDGFIVLESGERISHLRTLADDRYKDSLEYEFQSNDGTFVVFNSFQSKMLNTKEFDRASGNSGFYVKQVNKNIREYHCSHGLSPQADFSSLVFQIEIT